MTSHLFTLNWRDLGLSLLVAIFSAVLMTFTEIFTVSGLNLTLDDGKKVLTAAIAAGLAYLIKNFFSNNTGQFAATDK